ncbi:MAG: anthranilate phosphoribosyltransferase [Thermoleophilia bacterium]|nr:anthranilate phosphoribosyltransferase [Thermoleophilia bacterium]
MKAIDRLASGKDLEAAEAGSVLQQIMTGNASEVETAAFLLALRTKGETVTEVAGLARTMRNFSTRVVLPGVELVDTCGTGGDKSNSFNISTTAAFVAAGAGAKVAKHGNRGATSQSGSADVLEALGANLDLPAAGVARCIREAGIGFMFAPLHHQAMKHVVPVRTKLGVRTVFNILGPLTNPAGAACQVVGVFDGSYVELMARALKELGCRHGLVVHGDDGLDEITISGPTLVAEVKMGEDGIKTYKIRPCDFGLNETAGSGILKGGDAHANAAILRSILEGEAGARRDVVLLNAAAALYSAGIAGSIGDAVELAARSIDSGAAHASLEAFIKSTRKI